MSEMNEPKPTDPAELTLAGSPEAENATPPPKRDVFPWIYAAGFVVLAAGLVWLWQNPPQRQTQTDLAGRLATLEQRLTQLDKRPSPAVDLRPLQARLTALEQRADPASPDLAPLTDRVDALEKRPLADLGDLEQRLTAVEQRPAVADAAAIMSRLDALAGRQDALSGRAQDIEAHAVARQTAVETRLAALDQAAAQAKTLEARLEMLEQRLAATENTAKQVPVVAERAARLARLQIALAALEKGEKLGAIPDAPEALARFANTAPPTEAALRLSFPAAAHAAAEASSAVDDNAPLLDRVWSRAQSVVTLRQGDRVLVGDPAAGVLARARRALEAGDLAGTVAALGDLQGPAAKAMEGWRAEAQALLAARAALAELAARV